MSCEMGELALLRASNCPPTESLTGPSASTILHSSALVPYMALRWQINGRRQPGDQRGDQEERAGRRLQERRPRMVTSREPASARCTTSSIPTWTNPDPRGLRRCRQHRLGRRDGLEHRYVHQPKYPLVDLRLVYLLLLLAVARLWVCSAARRGAPHRRRVHRRGSLRYGFRGVRAAWRRSASSIISASFGHCSPKATTTVASS